jgi:hypothetical protein
MIIVDDVMNVCDFVDHIIIINSIDINNVMKIVNIIKIIMINNDFENSQIIIKQQFRERRAKCEFIKCRYLIFKRFTIRFEN